MNDHSQLLNEQQLTVLSAAFHDSSADASNALAKWIGKPSVVEIDSLEQLPIEDAADLLAVGDEPICFCSAEMSGPLSGEMILAFDNASGLALADMLLDQPTGTADEWTEIAISAALETTNILCCAFLNGLARALSDAGKPAELLPSPPRFDRDFAASLLEFALMGQAIASDYIVAVKTRFVVDGTPLHWTLLLVPDAASVSRLPTLLTAGTDVE